MVWHVAVLTECGTWMTDWVQVEEDITQEDVERIERHAPLMGLENRGGAGSGGGRMEQEGEPPRVVDTARSSGVEETKDSGPGTNHHQQELPGRAARRRELEVGPPASWMGVEEGIGRGFKSSLEAVLARMEAEGLDLGESYMVLHLEDLGDQLAEVTDAGEEGERWALAVVWPSVRAVNRLVLADLQFDVQGVLANLRGERGLPACLPSEDVVASLHRPVFRSSSPCLDDALLQEVRPGRPARSRSRSAWCSACEPSAQPCEPSTPSESEPQRGEEPGVGELLRGWSPDGAPVLRCDWCPGRPWLRRGQPRLWRTPPAGAETRRRWSYRRARRSAPCWRRRTSAW